ncbi:MULTISPECIES: hypothetical protein [Peptoniphilus]|uniref:hypothetical protein n=1 Tax=Peptoniphilus TaxID=162289 RepID=UPI000288AFBE|nr:MULTISPECIES: hypothetical protein [Peptoniphilus]MBS6610431.1 hypothetical protein [Peptoniphilus harei]MDU1043093.1 hypothetical protein [Peptoniphilus rhinitidis]MDU2114826.1 hypothetical protein [Peptoniphilus lacydonensis]MDU3750411.1 hypothetical protein [Peptoniphilus rhinitidis]MDU5377386.1 hypothetical protein [Peptoniphilus lacydonensis]
MNFYFITKSIIYISLEFLFCYNLEKSNYFNRKYFYLLSVFIILLEILKIKYYNTNFWDIQSIGALIGYNLYFFTKGKLKKKNKKTAG